MGYADHGIDTRGRVSGEVKTICPNCPPTRSHPRDKSLSVNLDKGCWNCHYCKWTGALGMRGEFKAMKAPKVYAKPKFEATSSEPAEKAVAFFEERGIPATMVKRYGIELRKRYCDKCETDTGALAFPFYRNGEIVNVKYRDREKHFSQESGCEQIFYGLDSIEPNKPLVIVEGEIDRMSVELAGIAECISVPNGTGTNLDDCLGSAEDLLAPITKIILAGDNDARGREFQRKLELRLGPERCWRVEWPEGCKDANEVLLRDGAGAILQAINDAHPVPIEGVFRVQDVAQDICDLYDNGIPQGLSTGWDGVTELYRPRFGETTYITGVPGSGKSAWLSALAVNMAMLHNWKFVVFPPEQLPLAQYVSQLMELYTGQPFTKGPTERMSGKTMLEAMAWANEHFILLNPGDEGRKLDHILELARQQIYRHDIKGVILDPWNELENAQPQGWTEAQYINHSLMRIRQFARNAQIHFWVVAHPRKLEKNRDGEYPVPTLYDINGGAAWYNKADNGIVVCRDKSDDEKPIEIYVQKVRFKYSGRLGCAELYFDRVTGRYWDRSGVYGIPKRAEQMGELEDMYGTESETD